MNQVMHKKNNILILLGFFLVILFITLKGERGIELKIEENGLTISATSGEKFYVDYKKIQNISFVSNFERGERMSEPESKKRGVSSGIWRNEQYGEYTLLVNNKIPSAIVVETDDGVIVFNYESKKTTGQFYETLKNHLDGQ